MNAKGFFEQVTGLPNLVNQRVPYKGILRRAQGIPALQYSILSSRG